MSFPAPATELLRANDAHQDGPLKGMRGHFVRDSDGAVRWLRVGGRLYPRASTAPPIEPVP